MPSPFSLEKVKAFLKSRYKAAFAENPALIKQTQRQLASNPRYKRELYASDNALLRALDDNFISPAYNLEELIDRFYVYYPKKNGGKNVSRNAVKRALLFFHKISNEHLNITSLARNRKKLNENLITEEDMHDDDLWDQDDLEKKIFSYVNLSIQDGEFSPKRAHEVWNVIQPSLVKQRVEPQQILDIQEKFLRDKLEKKEWLTDSDLDKLLKVYKLRDRVSIIEFSIKNIANVLITSSKRNHTRPYVLPLLINLGNYHWTRALIFVDPIQKKIKVRYRDSMAVTYDIDSYFQQGLVAAQNESARVENENGRSEIVQINNFPGYTLEKEDIDAQQEVVSQQDGWNCGYRAIKNLLDDPGFPYVENDNRNVDLQRFRKLKIGTLSSKHWSYRLRDEIYMTLMHAIRLNVETIQSLRLNPELVEKKDGKYKIKKDVIDFYAKSELSSDYEDEWAKLYKFSKNQLSKYKNSFFKAEDRTIAINDLIEKLALIHSEHDTDNVKKSVLALLTELDMASVKAVQADIDSNSLKDSNHSSRFSFFGYRNVTGSRFQNTIELIRKQALQLLTPEDLKRSPVEFDYFQSLILGLHDSAGLQKTIKHPAIELIYRDEELIALANTLVDKRVASEIKLQNIEIINARLSQYIHFITESGFDNLSQRSFLNFLSTVKQKMENFMAISTTPVSDNLSEYDSFTV